MVFIVFIKQFAQKLGSKASGPVVSRYIIPTPLQRCWINALGGHRLERIVFGVMYRLNDPYALTSPKSSPKQEFKS